MKNCTIASIAFLFSFLFCFNYATAQKTKLTGGTLNLPKIDAFYGGATCTAKSLDLVLDFDIDFGNIQPSKVREIKFKVTFSAISSSYSSVNWLAYTNDWLELKNYTVTDLGNDTYEIIVSTPNGITTKSSLTGATTVIVTDFETDGGGNFGGNGTCGLNSSSFDAIFEVGHSIKYLNSIGTLSTTTMLDDKDVKACESKTCSKLNDNTFKQAFVDTGILVSPNPANNVLTIQSEKPMEQIVLYSINGKQVENIIGNAMTQEQLVTDHLPNGSYLLRILTADGLHVQKIQVLH